MVSAMQNVQTVQLLSILKASAYAAYQAALKSGLLGDRSQLDWLTNTQPCDLVMEISTIALADRDRVRVRHLIGNDSEHVRLSLLGSGTEIRWTNARFIRVPESLDSFPEPI